MLPDFGTPEEEKVGNFEKEKVKTYMNRYFFSNFQMSQATILFEGAKYINLIKKDNEKVTEDIEAVKREIDELNDEIE